MECSVAAAVIAALLGGECAADSQQPIDPPYSQADELPEEHQPTAGGVPATVPRMDDRFGHDDRFGYDVPHRDRSRRQR